MYQSSICMLLYSLFEQLHVTLANWTEFSPWHWTTTCITWPFLQSNYSYYSSHETCWVNSCKQSSNSNALQSTATIDHIRFFHGIDSLCPLPGAQFTCNIISCPIGATCSVRYCMRRMEESCGTTHLLYTSLNSCPASRFLPYSDGPTPLYGSPLWIWHRAWSLQ